MAKFFGLDRIKLMYDTMKFHGGFLSSMYQLYRINDLPIGILVGEDNLGNKYYENNDYVFPRNRFVIYAPKFGVDYDGSMISADWYGWIHHKTDKLPSENHPERYSWITEYEPNMTGTDKRYVPYSTTKTKIEGWVPPKKLL